MSNERVIEGEVKLKVLVRVMVDDPDLTDEEILKEVENFSFIDTLGGHAKGFFHWLGGTPLKEILDGGRNYKYTSREYSWVRDWNKERNQVCSVEVADE